MIIINGYKLFSENNKIGNEKEYGYKVNITEIITGTYTNVTQTTEYTVVELNDICPHYVPNKKMDLKKLIDVWHPIFYQFNDKVPCFKMLIRIVSEQVIILIFNF